MTPGPRVAFCPTSRSVSRQRAVPPARLLAAPGADGHRQRRPEPGPPSACCGRWAGPAKVGQLQAIACAPAGAFYHATLGGAPRPAAGGENWQFPAGQRGGFCGD
ncbi:hypothetical protein LNQ03_30090 [Klebsiella pneumoniae subsp. pneumoniae]|nr:hypothetical protein [Klebsiella pneumoniae subsp. pneumoniae]